MRVMVTGDRGYIGSVLVPILINKKYNVVGYDSGFFSENLLEKYNENYHRITKDIRDVEMEDLDGIDCVIHLAGLSNDPLGELDPGLTEEINLLATLRLAEISKAVGVQRFIYSSSQSMYGVSNTDSELDEDEMYLCKSLVLKVVFLLTGREVAFFLQLILKFLQVYFS